MNEVLKYLGEALRRTYGKIVEKPMPWRMIDKLATLEETEEQKVEGPGEPRPEDASGHTPSPRPPQAD